MEANGVHEICNAAIMNYDVDFPKDMSGNIVMSGGTSMYPGINTRIEKEMTMLALPTMKIKVIAPPERSRYVPACRPAACSGQCRPPSLCQPHESQAFT